MSGGRWWSPDIHAGRRDRLLARGRIQAAVRGWFGADDFIEVDTAALQVSPGNETHLHAFRTDLIEHDQTVPRYLRTSPEFAAKKLLAAGEQRLFEFAKVFRNRETGRLNTPEFTMLEWYRNGDAYRAVMDDAVALVTLAARTAGTDGFRHGAAEADPFAPPQILTVAEAFRRDAGIDLLATLDETGAPVGRMLQEAAFLAGIRISDDDSWSDAFSLVMAERIEPRLGRGRPTLLTDYPAPEAALARRKPDDPRLAERFELFVAGVELANGFGELIDTDEQSERFAASMAAKERLYGERYPIDADFLAALRMMPPAAGVALGFDRLVMLATGADSVAAVQWTPVAMPGE